MEGGPDDEGDDGRGVAADDVAAGGNAEEGGGGDDGGGSPHPPSPPASPPRGDGGGDANTPVRMARPSPSRLLGTPGSRLGGSVGPSTPTVAGTPASISSRARSALAAAAASSATARSSRGSEVVGTPRAPPGAGGARRSIVIAGIGGGASPPPPSGATPPRRGGRGDIRDLLRDSDSDSEDDDGDQDREDDGGRAAVRSVGGGSVGTASLGGRGGPVTPGTPLTPLSFRSVRSGGRGGRGGPAASAAAAAEDRDGSDGDPMDEGGEGEERRHDRRHRRNGRGRQRPANGDRGGQERNQGEEQEDEDLPPRAVIWGTDINVPEAAGTFRDFLETFVSVSHSERRLRREERRAKRKGRRTGGAAAAPGGDGGDDDDDDEDPQDDHDDHDSLLDSSSSSSSEDEEDEAEDGDNGDDRGGKYHYVRLLKVLMATRPAHPSLPVDAMHLYYHGPLCQRLYHQLVMYPQEIVPIMDLVANRLYGELLRDVDGVDGAADVDVDMERGEHEHRRIQIRPYDLRSVSRMRALDPVKIDSLVSLRGMVVRTSQLIPDLKIAAFQCTICGRLEERTVDRGRIDEPGRCDSCSTRHSFALRHNRSVYANKQVVRLQETPDAVPAGETPASVVLLCYDDMVDGVRPGDRVEVTGIFRAQPRRVHEKITKVKSVYKTYVDVIHFRRAVGAGGGGGGGSGGGEGETNDAPGTVKDEKGRDGDDDDDHVDRAASPSSPTSVANPSGGGGGPTSARQRRATKLGVTVSRIAEIEALARDDPDGVYDKLTAALAPSIWEMDDVKRGVLCMLFGGNTRRVKIGTADDRRRRRSGAKRGRGGAADGDGDADADPDDDGHTEGGEEGEDTSSDESDDDDDRALHKRGDINILLCGDPGTSKSQLLSYVHKLAPRGVYTSGKGSSAVGLTASVVRDPETRELVLESGALVLSDRGVCCIDEFDKMGDGTRAILHEAMEQQTVSIAKAGIVCSLNARTSILASANPIDSRYNPRKSVVENVQLPPTLLSRFDLIYLILDSPNVENDRRLARHLVGLYYETPDVEPTTIDRGLLRDYIAYARRFVHPELSDLATRELISGYLDMRRMGSSGGSGGGNTIGATPRQLESLIRLSESLARMRLRRVVERADVREAIRLMRVATQAAATDPRTGRIDMDMIATGRSMVERRDADALGAAMRELLAERRGNRMAVSDVRRQLGEVMDNVTIGQEEVVEALRRMEADGVIQFKERDQTIFVRTGVVN